MTPANSESDRQNDRQNDGQAGTKPKAAFAFHGRWDQMDSPGNIGVRCNAQA